MQLFNSESNYVQKFLGDATLSKVAIDYMMTNAGPNRLRDMADLEPQKYFRRPGGVTVNGDGLMFVADNGSYRVQVYQKQAVPLTEEQFPPRDVRLRFTRNRLNLSNTEALSFRWGPFFITRMEFQCTDPLCANEPARPVI